MYMLDIYAAGHEWHIQPMINLVILVLTSLVYNVLVHVHVCQLCMHIHIIARIKLGHKYLVRYYKYTTYVEIIPRITSCVLGDLHVACICEITSLTLELLKTSQATT